MVKRKDAKVLKILFSWKMLLFWIIMVSTIFVAHATSGFLEKMVVDGNNLGWVLLFLWYLLWLGGIGTLIAYILMKLK